MGLGAFWVCQAAPLHLSRLFRSLGTQLVTAVVSAALWFAAGRGWAHALDRLDVFPGLTARLPAIAPLLLGLGVALFMLTAAVHYLLIALSASQEAERRALEFEIASREAELRALRAQIHPHFLFNSLNSVNALIASQPEEARRLCVRMADFLRRSLTVGAREAIPLAEELDIAEQLLSIERVRFGERLSHKVVADEAARACAVPPLLLQPLVENAVTHGIAQTIEGGGDPDRGGAPGPRAADHDRNPRDADAPGRKGTGIGLQNVRRRLLALHEDEADVRVLPGDDLVPGRAAPSRPGHERREARCLTPAARTPSTACGASSRRMAMPGRRPPRRSGPRSARSTAPPTSRSTCAGSRRLGRSTR